MARLFGFLLSFVAGVALVALGLLVPAHFRAINARTLPGVATNTPSVVETGIALAHQGKIGAASMFLQLALQQDLPDSQRLRNAIDQTARTAPNLLLLGMADPAIDPLLRSRASHLAGQPIIQVILQRDIRQGVIEDLARSSRPAVTRMLAIRNATNTVHFAPVTAPTGEALDVAVTLSAMLCQTEQLPPTLRNELEALAKEARWGDSQPLERVFLDLITLGRRLNWAQLTHFLQYVPNTATLQALVNHVAGQDEHLPVLFAALHMAAQPVDVIRYLKKFEANGINDLRFSLQHNAGGLRKVLASGRPVYHSSFRWAEALGLRPVLDTLTGFTANSRWLALCLKVILFFDGAFFLALAGTYLVPGEEYGRRLISATQLSLTAALLAIVLVWSEPFLIQQPQNNPMPLHWKFPMVEGPIREAVQKKLTPMVVDTLSLVSLSFFMSAQIVIYIFCRRKLAEIQRQSLPGRLKLRLLENEEHLFDAGLYFGFVGTVLSLVAVSIGVIKPSLMAAYSSTSFGIIFVSVLKIFYLRPYRQKLILETEGLNQNQ